MHIASFALGLGAGIFIMLVADIIILVCAEVREHGCGCAGPCRHSSDRAEPEAHGPGTTPPFGGM